MGQNASMARTSNEKLRPARAGLENDASDIRVKAMVDGGERPIGAASALIAEPDAVPRQIGHTAERHGFGMTLLRMDLILEPDAFPSIG